MAYEYEDKIPKWENQGTEPADSIKTEGYKAGYKPPAAYFNWFWSHVLNWLNDLRTKVSSLHTQVGTLETKIENIGTTGSGDMSSTDILTKLKTVDGSESGLDADTLDGMDATDFAKVDHTHTQYAAKTHNHSLATATSNGFMSSEMFSKLESIDPNNVGSGYTHPSTHPASMITGLSTVATTGNYADLVNKPTLSAVATSNDYNDLKNKPAAYVHPETHPASMITETNSVKMFLAEERAKLAAIDSNANYYEHPATHPASMISGLDAYIESLGFGRVVSGSYVGDGAGIAESGYRGSNEYTLYFDGTVTPADGTFSDSLSWYNSPRTITLPFAPMALMIFQKNTDTPKLVSQGQSYTCEISTTQANGMVEYIKLSGNVLYLAGAGRHNDKATVLGASFNKAGYTYNWLAF